MWRGLDDGDILQPFWLNIGSEYFIQIAYAVGFCERLYLLMSLYLL